MTAVDWITAVGIPSIAVCLVYIGGRLLLLSRLDEDMKKIKNNVSVIANSLIAFPNIEFDHGRLQACSPLQLTDNGNTFLDQIGFKRLFEQHYQDFFNCIKEEHPQNDYDIENSAIKCVFFLFDKPYFSEVKNYLYNNPKEDMKDVLKVAGIYVREKYMEHLKVPQ